MDGKFLGMSFGTAIGTVLVSVVVAEMVGYGLHRLLHSGRFPRLSRAHMIHHMELYGPIQAMRGAKYKDATEGRSALGNIGLEWVVPSAAILVLIWGALYMLGAGLPYRVLAISILTGWPLLMFSYVHDRMHLENIWLERLPVARIWYRKARRLHDIHHRSLNDEGKMDRNFGIGLFWYDRLFGTLSKRHCPFNWKGYRAALKKNSQQRMESRESSFPSEFRWDAEEENGEV
jgi:sterol desaturase/sphingolipid hydroxylase (fatty acid hydroxylase superfamily)